MALYEAHNEPNGGECVRLKVHEMNEGQISKASQMKYEMKCRRTAKPAGEQGRASNSNERKYETYILAAFRGFPRI